MPASTLLPDVAEVGLELIRSGRATITLLVRVTRVQAACPRCCSSSARIHSLYERRLADLPRNGIPVQVILHTRRFFCETPVCAQRIFTERLPNTVAPYARRTKRLSQTLECFTLALGGEAGARLARQMGILASGDTLIRQLRRRSHGISTPPRMLGIDDWAWRKGRRYGTILCDLERHRVIDLLPDRTVDSVKEWLQATTTMIPVLVGSGCDNRIIACFTMKTATTASITAFRSAASTSKRFSPYVCR
jgi:transposase